jgi:AmiR/NasT family two-component response regulator
VNRAFSHAISHGEGISLIPRVDGAEAARRAEAEGVGALLAGGAVAEIRAATSLPILAYDASADACIVAADHEGDLGEGVEVVVRVQREEQLEEVLERLDPEVLVLAPEDADAPLEQVLALLSNVPAGKLAIVELDGVTHAQIDELERAGVDAVLVREPLPAA